MDLIKNFRFLAILAIPILLFVSIYFIIRKPEINFVTNSNFAISNFTDIMDKGNSQCEILKKDNQIVANYTLGTSYLYPYAGIQVQQNGNTCFDIENYNLNLTVNSAQDFRLSLRVSVFLPNYTVSSKPLSKLIRVKTIGLKKGENVFQIGTNDINEIPDWWYKKNPEIGNKIKTNSSNCITNLWLLSDYSTPANQKIDFVINEFKLTYNFYPLLYWSLLISLVYYMLLFVLWKFKKEKIKYIFMPIEMTQVNDKLPKLQAQILAYIGSNYQNPDLKLIDVAQHVGLTQDATTDLLKKYSNKGFRQYLNQIRMEEAKRLLRESSLQISEISFKVGYNNIQHFNRVFKEYTDESPKNYRDKVS